MQGWRIGTIKGIDIEINYTWIVMFVLFTFLFANMLSPAAHGVPMLPWIGGAVAALLFVASVLLHELCHSLVALSLGISVRRITLFIFGGVSQVEGEVHTPRGEFLMSIAGPASSVALAFGFYFLAGYRWRPDGSPDLVTAVLALLAQINLTLAIFNMLPGLPLDGGRVLHSLLWSLSGNQHSSTRLVATFGAALGTIFMVLGGYMALFVPGGQMGLWMFFIGWLILSVARAEGRQAELKYILTGLQVGQVMHWPVTSVPAAMPLDQAVREYATARPQPLYPVVDETGAAVGVLDQAGLTQFDPSQWNQIAVSQAMEPLEPETMAVAVRVPATEALSRMAQNGRGWLLVTGDHNQPLGLVTEAAIVAAAGHRHSPAAT